MDEHKKLKEFIKEVGHEKAPTGFVDSVMGRIEAQSNSSFQVRPLISMKGWLTAASVLLGVVLFVYFYPSNTSEGLSFLSDVKDTIPSFSLDLPSFETSTAFTYGMITLLLMIGIQFGMLKRFFDNYYKES